MWNQFPIKNLLIDSLLKPIVESTYLFGRISQLLGDFSFTRNKFLAEYNSFFVTPFSSFIWQPSDNTVCNNVEHNTML